MKQEAERSADADRGLRWGVERRMEFIDFRLYWEGGINRRDLMSRFGVSIQQASADFARYQALAPQNLIYDRSARRYLAGPDYRPVFSVDDSDQYLAQLRSLSENLIGPDEAWMAEVPAFQSLPLPSRPIEPGTLRSMIRAIRDRLAVRICYQSMSRPDPIWRWISPHALGFSGLRWHVRAWCHIDGFFKDFVFSRIHEVGETRRDDLDPVADRAWFETVPVVIAPHPELSTAQRDAIARDYGMADGLRVIQVRRAFLMYFLKQLRIDDDAPRGSPAELQIVLANKSDICLALDIDKP